ncbi:protein asteroid homolog 1-like [Mya arenaria]|uniref:protein asteroid homolog 1-like n=1 Tax=Mya arenaria TaxID=6604 RepID=UPI0022E62ECB|nr:protein asteroid homolog 1-like [Mya arenaria]
MGVSGLFKVIDDSKLLTDYDLHDTRLIIDGSNLYHFLYNLPEEYGGNYDTYADTCKTFFATLKACKVEPYVVLDGGYDPDNQKWNTVVQRKESRIYNASKICKKGPDPIKPTVDMDDGNDPEWNTVLNRKTYKRARDVLKRENGTEVTKDHVWPILCEETFCHVLRELQIPHVKCPYEADREIAVLANMWKCPVLSNDSDFFIFKLEKGVIPIIHCLAKDIGMTLKHKKQTNTFSSLKEPATIPTDQEIVYITVKHYCYTSLIGRVNGQWEFLPILATFGGNDYVDFNKLKRFYTAICKKYEEKDLSLITKDKTRLKSLFLWSTGVKSETNAIDEVLEHVEDSEEEKLKLQDAIRYSLQSYKNIEDFPTMDVAKFFASDISKFDIGTMIDYVQEKSLPGRLLEMLRTCKMANSFLQNVAVNQRVIFNCQIEDMDEPSTYNCSRNIRKVLYGLTGKSKIEENDRQKIKIITVDITASTKVRFGTQYLDVPSLQNVPNDTVEKRQNIMFGTLGLNSKLIDSLPADPCATFLVGVLRFWWTNAEPKVTENHLSAAIIGMILLHSHSIRSDACETVKQQCLVPSIEQAIKVQDNDQVEQFVREMANEMDIHRNKHTGQAYWGNEEIKIIHGFSQLQTCYLSAVYLNQALMYPVDLPSPAVLFNCTLMYNVCRSLKTSKITDCSDNVCKSLETSKITNCSDNRFMRLETSEINDFADNICNSLETSENTDCSDIFPLKSPLHNLFTLWKTVVKTTESKDGVAG